VRTLLYCVLGDFAHSPPAAIRGVDGRAVTFVRAAGLAAALSAIEPVDLIPRVPRLVEYASVIEALFSRATVLPMRFGASFAGDADVARHLEEHARSLADMLRELDGCAEMGVRLWLLQDEPPAAGPSERQRPSRPAGTPPGTGRAYLEELRSQLEEADPLRAKREAAIERCARALAGIAVRHEAEPATREPAGFERLLAALQPGERAPIAHAAPRLFGSIHFLVKRELVPAFQERFRGLRPEPGTTLLISGPWPPYNFVAPDRELQTACMSLGPST
jgi:hypothetical protein